MNRNKLSFLWVLLLALAPALAACGDDDDVIGATPDTGSPDAGGDETPDTGDGPGNILEVAEAAGSFDTLLAAVDAAGLDTVLEGPGPLTVFAPTDEAFDALLGDLGITAEELLADDDLAGILAYHALAVEADSAMVISQSLHETVAGAFILVSQVDGNVFINDAMLVTADIAAENGTIHVIDRVLLPPPSILETVVADDENFSILEAVATTVGSDATDLLAGDGPLTVFAPTDDAFEALASALGVEVSDLLALPNLADILLYHVIDGGAAAADVISADSWPTLNGISLYVNATDNGVFLNDTAAGGVAVTATDILAANGVIHVIDAVLIPPTLDQVAELEGAFSTLLAAAATAEVDSETTVADVLADSEANLTVFAPTDDAFAALLGELGITAEELLADPSLTEYLLYHVVAGSVLADDVAFLDGVAVPTLLEQDPDGSSSEDNYYSAVIVDVAGDVFINGATVTAVDVLAQNGVIHVIDSVLLPTDAVAVAAEAGFSDLLSAATEAGLDDDLSAPNGPFTIFAPPNAAFQALLDSEASWTALSDIPIETLTAVLAVHVVPGYFTAGDLSDGMPLDTLAGEETLNVTIAGDGSVSLDAGGNSANVTAVDVPASNAIIHIIDSVIVPGS